MVTTVTTAPSLDETVAASAVEAPAPAREERGRSFGRVVGSAALVGLGLRIAIALTDRAPSTDEVAYLRSGLSLAAGDGFDRVPGRPELHFPPFVPFLMGLASKLFDDPHTAAVVITCLASAALVLPLALLARRAAGRRAGKITAWVVALTPGLSTTFVISGGGSEAVYTLLLVTAAWLAVVASSHTGRTQLAWIAGSGLSAGFAYLTRPEGLMAALPLLVAVVVPVVLVARAGGAGLVGWARAAALPGAAFLVALAVCVVPYARFLHSNTGSWELSAKSQDVSIEAWRAVADGDRRARDEELYALDESGLELASDERTSLPALAREDPSGYAGIFGTNVVNLFDTQISSFGGHPFVWLLLPLPLWGFAVLGAWRLRRSRTVGLLLAIGALPVATALVFFVQPRYLITAVAPATVLVGVGLASIASERRRRGLLAGTFVLLALSCAFAFEGGAGWGHPSDQLSQRRAGEWINANTAPDDRLMARSMVVEFYADRATAPIPYGSYDEILRFARHYGVEYLVVDPSTYNRLRPQLSFLRSVDTTPALRLVASVRADSQTTRIFALDPAPTGEGAPITQGLGYVGDATG